MKKQRWILLVSICILSLVSLFGCEDQDAGVLEEGAVEMDIQITSTAFKEGNPIPSLFTCNDKNISPPLEWTGVPESAESLAIIMDDPDAPGGTWTHWVLFNLPADLNGLEQGNAGNGTEGKNDFGKNGYGGPCPPRGSIHRYEIKIYALDIKLDLKAGVTKAQLEDAMQKHILAQGKLTGKFGR